MLTEMSFFDPGLCKLMLFPGRSQDPISNYRPLIITDGGLSCPGLEQGFAECGDGFGRCFPTCCANHCGEQTWGTAVME